MENANRLSDKYLCASRGEFKLTSNILAIFDNTDLKIALEKWASENGCNLHWGDPTKPDLCGVPSFAMVVDRRLLSDGVYETYLKFTRSEFDENGDDDFWFNDVCIFVDDLVDLNLPKTRVTQCINLNNVHSVGWVINTVEIAHKTVVKRVYLPKELNMPPNLSKSQFIRGLQCNKSLWLYQNKPELSDPVDKAAQEKFNIGAEVGRLAHQLFPGGDSPDFDSNSFEKMVASTAALIEKGSTTIYEAAFCYDNVFVMVDILHKGNDGWEIHEVKSSTEVKEVYINDVAIQYYVLSSSGLSVAKATVVHINNKYVRNGELAVNSLFNIADVTDAVLEKQDSLSMELVSIRSSISGEIPDRDIGEHCSIPYDCDFKGCCWQHIPDYSVFNLNRLNKKKKFGLYYQGIVQLEDIPADYCLSESQRIQVECELGGNDLIAKGAIQSFLESLWFPLCFLDFETFQQAVPLFDGLSPYQQIPFQYSLHFLEQADEELKHKEFLGKEGRDPRRELAERLVSDIPENACILAYNQGFEKGVIRKLAEQFLDLRNELLAIHDNIRDLMYPFQKKDYYTPQMRGSYSIKYVLPALVPELSYDELEVGNGGEAMSAYANLHLVDDEVEREKTRKALLEYCHLDTLAMVKIWEKLLEVSSR